MKKLLLVLLIIPTLAQAQQKPEIQVRLEANLGAMFVENIGLNLKIEALTKQLSEAQIKIKELEGVKNDSNPTKK